MPKPRAPKGAWDARAAEVLSGHALDPGELIDLIHEVNPTGKGRGAEETTARYAVKSRLQSLLIVRYGDDLEILPDPHDPGVAALRHRYRRQDACHAVITALDDEARSRVQRALDLGGADSERHATPVARGSNRGRREAPVAGSGGADDEELDVAALLAAGEEAQAAYDYEGAGRYFSRAVEASGGTAPAAVAFLAFSVDALAADADALAVERRLPAATVADPQVALLLAVAAARSGDEERALGHLAHTRDPRAAEVLSTLARRALEAHDVERAERHARAAEEHDPAHPELRALADAVAALRAAERAPREAELSARLAAGREAEALAEANAILARWPESEPARRAIRHLEERLRAGEGRRHLLAAEEAFARGETAVALDLLRHALASPLAAAEREAALKRAQQVEAADRDREHQRQLTQVLALLARAEEGVAESAQRARGLTAYVELDDEVRAAVRAASAIPELGWLDQIPGARGRVRPAVEAVLALARASALVDRDSAAAAALVAAHDRLLDEVPLARSIVERARLAAAEDRARRALGALREAEDALAAEDLGRARDRLDHVDLRALPDAERARADAFEVRLAAAEERHRLARRFERLRGVGAFAAAREVAAELGARATDVERARWIAASAAIDEHVQRVHAPLVEELSGGPELLQHPAVSRYGRPSSAWIGDGERELVMCTAEHAWLFVRVLDLETGRAVRSVRIALDEPMYDVNVTVHGGFISIIGTSGVFELTRPSLSLSRRFVRNWHRGRGLAFGDGLRPGGGRMLWGQYGVNDDETVKVVDLDGEIREKVLPSREAPHLVAGAAEPRVVITKDRYDEEKDRSAYSLRFFEAGGVAAGSVDLLGCQPKSIAAHPTGGGCVVLTSDPVVGDHRALMVLEFSARGDKVSSHPIQGPLGWKPVPEILSARGAGLVFVRVSLEAGGADLIAFGAAGPGAPLAVRYRVPIPERATLIQDPGGHRVFVFVDHPGGIEIKELGTEPPVLRESGVVHFSLEPFHQLPYCAEKTCDSSYDFERYFALRRCEPSQRQPTIDALEAKALGDLDASMRLFYSVVGQPWPERAAALLARIEARHPDVPQVILARLVLVGERRAWGELGERIDAIDPGPLPAAVQQHLHHLRALSHAVGGDLSAARQEIERGLAFNDPLAASTCRSFLTKLETTLAALVEPVTEDDLAFDRPATRQLVAVLRAADARLAAGDPTGALVLLERPLVWDLREAQSLSRLAAAHLVRPAVGAGERLRKALALGAFLGCVDTGHGNGRPEELAPGLVYPEPQIDALREAARAWMVEDQGVPIVPGWPDP
jgi:hypothetical protein